MAARSTPQAALSSYAPRLRTYNNSLLTPVISVAPTNPLSRTTKRGTTVINYAETDNYDDYDDDSDDPRRRYAGLRNLRREDSAARVDPSEKVGKETDSPVQVQGIWREHFTKPRLPKTDVQTHAQASMPLTLIPVRIDVDIPAFTPAPAIPPTHPAAVSDPMYKPGETTVPYRLKDIILWNLHETLITTDQFALTLVQDLDLPNAKSTAAEISKQIRTQLEEYAGVALHPLFHSQPGAPTDQPKVSTPAFQKRDSQTPATSRQDTPARTGTPAAGVTSAPQTDVQATASLITADSSDYNPDDTYRCIVNLSINMSSQLYTDKFEWSLLHPPGTAEAFARLTCADLGLSGEWVPALTHAIYEAVLKLKKEACESGGVVSALELNNDAAVGTEAGWRYDPESLADDWEPKIETLSREEIEKREGDRERQLRRLRRETARFSSNTGMVGGVPALGASFGALIEAEEERMGRGERSKKKRRFRSLSPLGRSGTPGGRGTPDVGGYGGGGTGTLMDAERATWRCSHCRVWGTCVWAVRDGPYGPRSLCNNCGFAYEQDRRLPRWLANLHALDQKLI